MGKHTAGPWEVQPEQLFDGKHVAGRCPKVAKGGQQIARVSRQSDGATCQTAEANARLIAASPELLEELYRALPFLEDMLEDPCYKSGAVAARIKAIRAAIAKAEGGE